MNKIEKRQVMMNDDIKFWKTETAFTKALLNARKAKGVTTRELAERIGESHEYVLDIITGRKLPLLMVASIIEEALECAGLLELLFTKETIHENTRT